MSKLLFAGGRAVTADGGFEADVLVEDGKATVLGTGLVHKDGSGRFAERSFTAPDLAVRA